MRGMKVTEFVSVEDLVVGDRVVVRDGRGKRLTKRDHTVVKTTFGRRPKTVELVHRRGDTGRVFSNGFVIGTKFEREVSS